MEKEDEVGDGTQGMTKRLMTAHQFGPLRLMVMRDWKKEEASNYN